MKKHWVKRENIIYYNNYKPFYKQKFKVLLLFVFLMAIIFFVYQVYYVSQLSEGLEKSHVKYNDTLQQPAASAHIKDEKTERYIPR
jgi:membrane-anchored glycerophosphoryl diester phosphodiesterase (GDPDase)